jgi:sec-independent protein translocase protein TatB
VDTICGVGLPELIILALLGFVVIGPERSREVALNAGRFLRKVMTSPWWKDFSSITKSLRDLPNTLVRMAEIEEAQADLERTMRDIEDLTRTDLSLSKDKPPAAKGEEPITDPWGIRNAAAGTVIKPSPAAPEPEEPPETSQEDDEQPAG